MSRQDPRALKKRRRDQAKKQNRRKQGDPLHRQPSGVAPVPDLSHHVRRGKPGERMTPPNWYW